MKKKTEGSELSKLGNEALSTLIPILILVIFIILTGMVIINFAFGGLGNTADQVEDIWYTTFTNMAQRKVGIVFDSITTSEDEYVALRVETNKIIEDTTDETGVEDNKLKVDTEIKERLYVDNTIGSKSSPEDAGIMNETGPIYLQDAIILRYITTDGTMRILAAQFNEDKSGIEIVKQSDLKNMVLNSTAQELSENLVSEEAYISDIMSILTKIFNASSTSEFKEAKKLSNKYFSSDGKNTVFKGRESINITEALQTTIQFIGVGKSDNTLQTKDRIYTQLELKSASEVIVLNMVLKMNEYGRIFDVDII